LYNKDCLVRNLFWGVATALPTVLPGEMNMIRMQLVFQYEW